MNYKYVLTVFALVAVVFALPKSNASATSIPGCSDDSAYSTVSGAPCNPGKKVFNKTLRYGMKNDAEITELQKILIAKGYLTGTPNGMIYQTTRDAIKKFQEAYGLKSDGVVGLKTRDILNSLANGDGPKGEGLIDRSVLQSIFNSTFPMRCEGGNCAKQETGYSKITGSQYFIWAIDPAFDDSIGHTFRSAMVDCSANNSCVLSVKFPDAWSCQKDRGHQNFSQLNCI